MSNSARAFCIQVAVIVLGMPAIALAQSSISKAQTSCSATHSALCEIYTGTTFCDLCVSIPDQFDVATAADCAALIPPGGSGFFGDTCYLENSTFRCSTFTDDACSSGRLVLAPTGTAIECTDQAPRRGSALFDSVCLPATIPLPVELSSFKATVDHGDVLLTWTTASELNNAGFELERKSQKDDDAEGWRTLAFVEGSGSTDVPQAYGHRIAGLEPGIHSFRLKQIDFDGTFSHSETVEAAIGVPGRFVLESAYPNPFNPTTTIRFAVATEQHVEVTLMNSAGQAVKTLFSGSVSANEMQDVRVDASGLSSGTYLVHFTGQGISAVETIVLSK